MKKLFVAAVLLAGVSSAFAQSSRDRREEKREERKEKINALMRQEEEGVMIYNKQTTFGFQARTNGYGAFVEIGRMKDRNITNLYQIEFTETKHPKEEKDQLGASTGGGLFIIANNPFIYDKQNYFYSLKLGMGQSRRIGDKGNKNGVSVHAIYLGGLSLGLLRPYYLTINDNAMGTTRDIKYGDNPVDDASFLFTDADRPVLGGAGIGKGWGEIKIKPGAYAKTGLRFDYGRFNEIVSALEIGLFGEFYADAIPIMIAPEPQRFFFGSYIAIEFGKRK